MTIQVDGFDWDDGSRNKCERHGVSVAEIEGLFAGVVHVVPDLPHSDTETRSLAIGRMPTGRHVFLAFTVRQKGARRLIRPISARYMHAKEVKHYEAQIANSRQ